MVKGRISRGGQFWVEAANLEVRATLEQDTKRWRDGWCQLRSRIEWLEAKEQQGSGQSKLRTSGDLVVFREKGTRVFWVEPGHVMPGPGWHQMFSGSLKEWRSFGEASETKCANRRFSINAFFRCGGGAGVCRCTLPRPWLSGQAGRGSVVRGVTRSCVRVGRRKGSWIGGHGRMQLE